MGLQIEFGLPERISCTFMSSNTHSLPTRTFNPALPHIASLDGLRGVAILLVLAVHTGLAFRDNPHDILPFLSRLGWIGVDLFFVLSGFLITRILLSTTSSKNYFTTFYMRRSLRIFPIYYVALLITALVIIIRHNQVSTYIPDVLWCLTYLQNFIIGHNPFIFFEPLGPYWSLAIEEQFYVCWPLIVLWAGAKRLPWLCGGLIILIGLVRSVAVVDGLDVWQAYMYTPFRTDALLCGAFIAATPQIAQRYRLVILGMGLILSGTAMLVAKSIDHFTQPMCEYGLTGVDLVFAAVLIFLIEGKDHKIFVTSALLSAIGRVSYCMYIVHYAVIIALWKLQFHVYLYSHSNKSIGWIVFMVTTGLLSFLIASLSYRFFEAPILSLKSRWRY